MLAAQLTEAGIPFLREVEFARVVGRRWRFDFALPAERLAIEVEGGVWLRSGGRHGRGEGFETDAIKYAEALCLGWRVLRVTTRMVNSKLALRYIQRALGLDPTPITWEEVAAERGLVV